MLVNPRQVNAFHEIANCDDSLSRELRLRLPLPCDVQPHFDICGRAFPTCRNGPQTM